MGNRLKALLTLVLLAMLCTKATCKYGFTDAAPPPPEIKTFRVNAFENRAYIVNPLLAPELAEKVRQKIMGTTKLKLVLGDDAHYDINGFIRTYDVSTVGVTNNTASTNRLSVVFHLEFKNTLDNTKNFEADITRTQDFAGDKTLIDVESEIMPKLINDMADDVFNRIFSNW